MFAAAYFGHPDLDRPEFVEMINHRCVACCVGIVLQVDPLRFGCTLVCCHVASEVGVGCALCERQLCLMCVSSVVSLWRSIYNTTFTWLAQKRIPFVFSSSQEAGNYVPEDPIFARIKKEV